MENLGYYNGKYDLIDNMMIPMNDRVCWFGDGVYDAGPCRNYHIFALEEHIDRFFHSAAMLDIGMPVTKEALKDLLNDLVKKLDTGNLFVYYQVTRGTGDRMHDYPEGKGNLWVMIRPAEQNFSPPSMRLITLPDTRFFHCNIKTLNLIPSVMAAQKAKLAGCQESVFYRPGGRVTECAHSNVHILKGGILYTAPTDELILPGIARAHLLAACRELDIPVEEEAFFLKDLFAADEVLITSSSLLCNHASEIDQKPVGCKAEHLRQRISEYLQKEFMDATD